MPGKLVSRMSKRECYTLKQSDTIKIASQELSEKKIGCMPVIDDKKNVAGIFTDGDLRRTLKKNPNISNILLKTVMTKKFIKVTDDILAAEALTIMEKNEITSLIVVDRKKSLSGLLTLNLLLKKGIE